MHIHSADHRASKLPIEAVLLAAIFLLALVLRFARLNEWNFWIDELFTIRDAINHNQILIYDLYQVRDPAHYPFQFRNLSLTLVRMSLGLFGIHEWSARIPAVLFGSLSIPLLYVLVRRVFSVRVALFAALFLAISPWHLFLSQNARYYTPLIFFFTLSFFAFYFSLEKDSFSYLLISIALMGFAVLERVHALFFAPVIVFYLLLLLILPYQKPAGLNRRNLVLFTVLPVALYLLYEAYTVFILGNPSFLATFLGPKFLGLTTSRPRWLLTNLITDVGVPLAVLAVAGSYFLWRERNRIGLLLSLNAVVPLFFLMALAPFFQTFNHYLLISLPSWIILGAVGLVRLYHLAVKRRSVWWIGGLLAFIFLLFIRDRVIRDLAFYFQPSALAFALLALGGLALILAVYFLPVRKCPGDLVWIPLLLVTLAHPLVANTLYYRYQHGYRDNEWRWVMQAARQYMLSGDAVASAMAPVASYYLGEKVIDLENTDLDQLLQEQRRYWLIDEFGVYRMKGQEAAGWIEAHCERVGGQMRILRGEPVMTRLALCEKR